MKDYDEYQKIMRYKYGYYSLNLLLVLLMINLILKFLLDSQWDETKELETLFIIGIVGLFFSGLTVYHNADFGKNDNVRWNLLADILLGIFYTIMFLPTAIDNPKNFVVNGKLTYDSFYILLGMIFFTRPVIYFIRKGIDKLRDKE